MLLRELHKLQLQQKLISIDRGCHNEELTGFLVKATESYVLLQLFTDDGDYDGLSLFEIDQIEEVFWGNREHEAIAALIDKSKPANLPKLETESFTEAMRELIDKFSSVMVFTHHDEDNFSIAQVTEQDDEWLKLYTFGPKRSLSRLNQLVRKDNVSRLSVDSPYQRNIEALHNLKL